MLLCKVMGGCRESIRLYGGEVLHQPQKDLILCEAIHKVQAGIFAGNGQRAVDNVKVL